MVKIECWRKVGGGSRTFKHFARESKKGYIESLFVHKQDYDKTAWGYNKKSEWTVTKDKKDGRKIDKILKNEKEANNYANSYMKKHNKC